MDDELRPECDLDGSQAKPDRIVAPWNQGGKPVPPIESSEETTVQRIVKLVVIAVPCALICGVVLSLFAWYQSWQETERDAAKLTRSIPDLVPAPSEADQIMLVTAIKNFPNSPIDIGAVVPLGADAANLTTLLSALKFEGTSEGITCYRLDLQQDFGSLGNKALIIEIAGNPPRVIRRTIHLSDNS
jgi:hypothetical protein